ncbi:hypothetical protein, partial [Roseovarius sp. MBR-6]|uniref:hypothetical protein n=1 Tax=Roseovarius sp. MBR-6 TaxID=3156459 RepID=UPI0033991C5A
TRKGKGGRLLRRPQQAHPAATVADFRTAVLKIHSSRLFRFPEPPLTVFFSKLRPDEFGRPQVLQAVSNGRLGEAAAQQ